MSASPWALREPSLARRIAEIAAVAAVYVFTARLGMLLAIPGSYVTPLWPPSGVALGALLVLGWRVWPGIWIGCFAGNLTDFSTSQVGFGPGLLASGVIACGGSAQAFLGAWLLRHFTGGRNPLHRVRDVCVLIVLAVPVSCIFGASLGVATLVLTGITSWSVAGSTWLTWWLGDTAGVHVITPLLLAWATPSAIKMRDRRWEALACFVLLASVAVYVFLTKPAEYFHGRPHTFLLLPFLVWPSIRFGPRGATAAVLLVEVLVSWGTTHGLGPFDAATHTGSLLLLAMFLSVTVVTALCTSAGAMEREEAEAGRRRLLDHLESTVRERTGELTRANATLQTQIDERTRAESAVQSLLAETDRSRRALLSIVEDERRAEATLRSLAQRLLTAEDEERRRIAKELHDSTAQDLVAVMMNLGQIEETLGERKDAVSDLLADTHALLENCATEIRTLSYVLHPPMLDETGLAGAFREYAEGFSKRTGIAVRVEAPPGIGRQPRPVEIALFRVVQEGLGNVLRHSHSATAVIRLAVSSGSIIVEIEDAGCGLPAEVLRAGAGGVGIAGMRERLQQLGGRLELASSRAGTIVRGILPLEERRS